jgi:hypothetical protein
MPDHSQPGCRRDPSKRAPFGSIGDTSAHARGDPDGGAVGGRLGVVAFDVPVWSDRGGQRVA